MLKYGYNKKLVINTIAVNLTFFICPIAIRYSYGTDNKIGLRLSVCLFVSHGRISLSIFTKFDTEV